MFVPINDCRNALDVDDDDEETLAEIEQTITMANNKVKSV